MSLQIRVSDVAGWIRHSDQGEEKTITALTRARVSCFSSCLALPIKITIIGLPASPRARAQLLDIAPQLADNTDDEVARWFSR
jgi:hypothetical protein